MKHDKKQHRPSPGEGNPSPEDVARRAYEIYLARGCEPGHEFDDWLQAEREIYKQDQVLHNE